MLRRYFVACFRDEGSILRMVKKLRQNGFSIYDTYTPYAVHGLDEAMGVRRTRLPWVTFIAAFIGCFLALFLQIWTSAIDWPINVGGKPGNSWPAFIPVTFEMTILLGGLISVAAFFFRDKLLWGQRPKFEIEGVTDDVFALVLKDEGQLDKAKLEQEFKRMGAFKVEEKVILL